VADLRDMLTGENPDLPDVASQTGQTLAYTVGWRIGWLGSPDDSALDCLTPTMMMTSREVADYITGKVDGGEPVVAYAKKCEEQ
jgi:hypothetical protein